MRLLIKFSACLLLLGWVTLPAQIPEDQVSVKYEYYDDNNGVTIHQELLRFTKSLGRFVGLSGHANIDGMTAASRKEDISIRDSSLTLDAITASSVKEIRQEYGGKLTGVSGNSSLGVGVTTSREKDYHSNATNVSIRQNMFNDNANLILNYTLFDDIYEPEDSLLYEGGKKLTHSATVGWTQTISPTTLAVLTLGGNYSEGFVGRPYYHVWIHDVPTPKDEIAGQPYKEAYPDNKESYLGMGMVKQAFNSFYQKASVTLDYRYYWDSWSNTSHTGSIKLSHYLYRGLLLHLRYRAYQQSGVSFYRDVYTTADITGPRESRLAFITVDPKMAPFTTHLLSAKLAVISRNFLKPDTKGHLGFFPTRIDLEVQRYLRSTHENENIRMRRYESYGKEGLQAWIIRAGLVFAF